MCFLWIVGNLNTAVNNKTRQAMYAKCSTDARSRNQYCRVKTVGISCSYCVFAAFVVQHE